MRLPSMIQSTLDHVNKVTDLNFHIETEDYKTYSLYLGVEKLAVGDNLAILRGLKAMVVVHNATLAQLRLEKVL